MIQESARAVPSLESDEDSVAAAIRREIAAVGGFLDDGSR